MGSRFSKVGRARPAAFVAALALMSCQAGPYVGLAKTKAQIEVLRLKDGASPPPAQGVCWASDTAPAVIETVTEHVQVRPERRDATGAVVQAAEFQTRTAQRMVQDRATVWFKSPCPAQVTVAFVASLQRALKARGRFYEPITGAWDAATLAALRKYQRERGLDSAQLSLAAAQELGLAATSAP